MQVVGFVKRVNPGFPVGSPFADDVAHAMHFVQFIALKVPFGQTETFLQRRRLVIQIDENDTGMRLRTAPDQDAAVPSAASGSRSPGR